MSLLRALNYANEFINDNPQHSEEVKELYELMESEIEEGGSVEGEIDNFISACDDLVNLFPD